MTLMAVSDIEHSAMNAAEALLGPALSAGLGDTAAIDCVDGAVTFRQLDERANQAARAFTEAGLKPQDRMLLLMHDRPEFFYVYLGALKAGIVPVGLNVRLSVKDLAHIIGDSGARLVVAEADFIELFDNAVAGNRQPPQLIVHGGSNGPHPDLAAVLDAEPPDFDTVFLKPDDMALWMYTSGTTGNPKAVVHAQRAIPETDRYFDELFRIGPGDRVFATSKLFFAFSLGHILLCTLRRGATAILYSGWPAPENVVDTVNTFRPTVFLSVPTMYKNLLEGGVAKCFDDVRLFLSAGERLPVTLFERWRDVTGRCLCEGIGATENFMLFIANDPADCRPGASGKPLPGVSARLVDDEGNDIDRPQSPGVLWIRSNTLALGYWRQPRRTEAVFRDGWYCTGDMFSRDAEGFFSHEGRADDMLKISGQWVSPVEIEDEVLKNPLVRQAAVVAAKNEDGLVRLALCVVLTDGVIDRAAFEHDLIDDLKSRLSIYKCPRRFVYLDDLPLTPTGKLQRFRLRDIVAESLESQAAG